MYRKDVNERSPMRIFEKSMHGGLGRGCLGVVASRAGVGKTPLLVQVALDDLMRDRRVLHISHDHAVDHVRAYYDEIFHDLSVASKLADPEGVRLDIERRRLICSHLNQAASLPPSLRGGRSSIQKILETVAFAREVAHFEPDAIIIDGFDLWQASGEALVELSTLARERNVELWLAANAEAVPSRLGELPEPLQRFAAQIAVIVYLVPDRDVVHLRLLKDHDNTVATDLQLRLDPHSMELSMRMCRRRRLDRGILGSSAFTPGEARVRRLRLERAQSGGD